MKKFRKQFIYFVLVTIVALFIAVSSKTEVDGAISYPTLESLPKPIFSDFSDYNYVTRIEELWYDSPNEKCKYYKGTAIYKFELLLCAPVVSGEIISLSPGTTVNQSVEISQQISEYYGETISNNYETIYGSGFMIESSMGVDSTYCMVNEEYTTNVTIGTGYDYSYAKTTSLQRNISTSFTYTNNTDEYKYFILQERKIFEVYLYYNYWVKKPYVTLGNNLGEYHYDNYYSLALGNASNSTIGMHEYDYYQNKYHYIGPGEEGVLFV